MIKKESKQMIQCKSELETNEGGKPVVVGRDVMKSISWNNNEELNHKGRNSKGAKSSSPKNSGRTFSPAAIK